MPLLLCKQLKIFVILFALMCHLEISMASKLPVDDANDDANWWHNAVFYQIYPRSFKDSNGDGIGDLQGIISKLEHLSDTGITATWLSPIFKSPMVDFGYDISDFKDIHHEYGTMEDFGNLIEKANQLGIKIILDFVPNHSSNEHEWFVKSEAKEEGYEDFYVWADGQMNETTEEREPPNNWQSVFYGSAWTWSEHRQQFYLHQFTREQPDLNFRNPRVVEAMDEVLTYWLDKGVAGFRIDAVNHLFEDPELSDEPLSGKTADKNSYDYTNHIYTKDMPEVYDMLHHWRALLDHYSETHDGPQRIMMTEAYADLKSLMDYYENALGKRGSHFPFNFHFISDLNADSDARDFVHTIQKWLTFMPPGGQHIANWVMGNHDNPRVASRYGPERVDAMNMLIMTLPGVAVTYNGEEIGMLDYRDISWEDTVDPAARNVGPAKYKKYSRDPERTPFQWDSSTNAGFSTESSTWLPVHPNYGELNLELQQGTTKSHYKTYKALVELRQMPVLKHGKFQAEVLTRHVFAFKRYLKGHAPVVTVINLSPEDALVDLVELLDTDTGNLEVLVAGKSSSYDTGSRLPPSNFTLIGNEALVLQILGYRKGPKMSEERRALIKTCLKSANVILVALLMYKLWNNKWTKLNFNKYALE